MRLTWDPEGEAWVGDVSHAGPAGTAAITVAGVWIEFDRVDAGRIVSLFLPPDGPASVLLGDDTLLRLAPPADDRPVTVDIDLHKTRLWRQSGDLAFAAELAEDAARLESSDVNAAVIAYGQFGDVLRDLGDLAPTAPARAFQRMLVLCGGYRPLLDAAVERRFEEMIRDNCDAVPPDVAAQLIQMLSGSSMPPMPFAKGEPFLDSEQPSGGGDSGKSLLRQVQEANTLGREALCTEQSDPPGAAAAWRRCARAWFVLKETGRAAIALDRAADSAAAARQPGADADRDEARDRAAAWALPQLDGGTGRPHRPLWCRALRVPASLAEMPSRAGHPGATDQPYVAISYAAADREYVDRLAAELSAYDIPIWYDRDLSARTRWLGVRSPVDDCAALVVVMSPAATESEFVRVEIDRAQARARPLRPILLSGPPMRRLANISVEHVKPGQMPSRQFITQLARDLAVARPSPTGRQPRIFGRGIPARNPHFRGRERSIEELADRLSTRRRVAVRAHHGANGVGKSALAAEFVHGHAAAYEFVAWIDAGHPELIAHQVAAFAPDLGVLPGPTVSDTAREAIAALGRGSGRWLIVFDNALSPADLEPWLPRHGSVDTIVTSPSDGWDHLAESIRVDRMAPQDAVRLLRARASTVGESVAEEIAEVLGHLPLALEQAAGHLATTGDSADAYLRALVDQVNSVRNLGYLPQTYEHAVHAVWDVARPRLRADSRAAEQLLQVCSFLGPAPIPLWLYSQHADVLPSPLSEVARDAARLSHTVDGLVARSLMHYGADGLVVHELLGAAVGRRMSMPEREQSVAAVRVLLDRPLPPEINEREVKLGRNRSAWPELLPHMLSVANNNEAVPETDRASLLARAGDYLLSQGEPAAGALIERAFRIDQSRDPNDPVVARRLNSLALLFKEVRRQPAQARDLLEQALRIDEANYGTSDPRVAGDLQNLASVLSDLGRITEAVELLERALRIHETVYGPSHRRVANDLNRLGELLRQVGRSEDAQSVLNRALRIEKTAHINDPGERPGTGTGDANTPLAGDPTDPDRDHG